MVQHPAAPLDQREVRWAISYAINKNKLNFAAFEGATKTTKLPYPYYGTITPYLDEWKEMLEKYDTELYDPKKAVEIFEDLGFEKGRDGIYVTPDGIRLSWVIISRPGPDTAKWHRASARISRRSASTHRGRCSNLRRHGEAWRRNDYDMNVAWACAQGLGHAWDPYAWLEGFHSKYAMPEGESADQNRIRYSDPEYDRLLDELTGLLPDDPRAKEVLMQAQEIYMRDLPVIGTLQTVFSNTFDTLHWKGFPECRGSLHDAQSLVAALPVHSAERRAAVARRDRRVRFLRSPSPKESSFGRGGISSPRKDHECTLLSGISGGG